MRGAVLRATATHCSSNGSDRRHAALLDVPLRYLLCSALANLATPDCKAVSDSGRSGATAVLTLSPVVLACGPPVQSAGADSTEPVQTGPSGCTTLIGWTPRIGRGSCFANVLVGRGCPASSAGRGIEPDGPRLRWPSHAAGSFWLPTDPFPAGAPALLPGGSAVPGQQCRAMPGSCRRLSRRPDAVSDRTVTSSAAVWGQRRLPPGPSNA